MATSPLRLAAAVVFAATFALVPAGCHAAATAAAAAVGAAGSDGPPLPAGDFDWIAKIAAGPAGQKVQLEAKLYLIDKQYQLPRGTELRGAGTAPSSRTTIKAVGAPYNACAGTASGPGLIQGRKGLLLGDDTYVSGLHMVGMETKRLDCLYAMIETPGCVSKKTALFVHT
eukprot:COSAG06_NODE_3710_length_4992_cov_24.566115_1_plen_171_part_00